MSIGFHWYMRLWAPKKWDNCGLWSDIGISLESVHYIIMFFNHSKLVINQGWFGDDPPENSCANLTMLHHFAIKRSKNNSNLKNTKTESMGFSHTHTLCMYIYVYVIIIIYMCVSIYEPMPATSIFSDPKKILLRSAPLRLRPAGSRWCLPSQRSPLMRRGKCPWKIPHFLSEENPWKNHEKSPWYERHDFHWGYVNWIYPLVI